MARSRQLVGLPVLSDPEVPLYTGHLTGHLDRHLRLVGRNRLAEKIFPVTQTSKLPCLSWGISATRCRIGSLLANVEGSVCHPDVCYAKNGRFLFDNVQKKLEQAYEGLFHELWVPAAIYQIDWTQGDLWRWFHSGDIQGIPHLQNILTIIEHTRNKIHWLPTREKDAVLACKDRILAFIDVLRLRASATMVDGPPPTWWPWTSTVLSSKAPGQGICPAPEQNHACENCRACTDRDVKNVAYRNM